MLRFYSLVFKKKWFHSQPSKAPVPIAISQLQKRGLKGRFLLLLISKQAKNNAIFCRLMVVIHNDAPIAQLDRASVFETEGWAFESLWDHHP